MRWRHETWRKLYINESPSFAQLPLFARALGAELLKICDDAGRIYLKGKSPAEAVAFALGATQSDRRLLKTYISALIEDGYLVLTDTHLVIRNFPDAQARYDRVPDDAPTQKRVGRDSASTRERVSLESASSQPRVSLENVAKPSESLNPAGSAVPCPSETDSKNPHTPEENTGTRILCPTSEPANPFPADVALDEIRKASDGEWTMSASAPQLAQFARLAQSASPPLTLDGCRLLGRAYARGKVLPWLKEKFGSTPTLGQLLKNDGERLFEAVDQAYAMDREDKAEEARKKRDQEHYAQRLGQPTKAHPVLKTLLKKEAG